MHGKEKWREATLVQALRVPVASSVAADGSLRPGFCLCTHGAGDGYVSLSTIDTVRCGAVADFLFAARLSHALPAQRQASCLVCRATTASNNDACFGFLSFHTAHNCARMFSLVTLVLSSAFACRPAVTVPYAHLYTNKALPFRTLALLVFRFPTGEKVIQQSKARERRQ